MEEEWEPFSTAPIEIDARETAVVGLAVVGLALVGSALLPTQRYEWTDIDTTGA